MQKEILLEILKQNQFTSHFSFDRVNKENASLRLNANTASIGFIFQHIGETINLFGQLLGIPTDVKNTTIGQTDNGQEFDVEYSRQLISRGYGVLKDLVENSADEDWLKPVDTPFLALRKNLERYASVAHFEKLIIEPPARPKGHFRRNGLNQSLAVEMARHGNRGKVQPRLFHRFHRAWKSRNRRGISTFPQPRRRRVSLTPKGEPRQNRGSRQILAESGILIPA